MSETLLILPTASGRRVCTYEPSPDQVCLEDIARSLSRQCRFAGHLRADVEFYSVAQHSVIVSQVCSPQHALEGLLHDAAEAYLQDVIRPNKVHVVGPEYHRLERLWLRAIGEALGLDRALERPAYDVIQADDRVLATEFRDLLHYREVLVGVEPLQGAIIPLALPSESYTLFKERFAELMGLHPLAAIT